MSNCEKILKVLYEYLDCETKDPETLDIKQHLDLCRECFNRYDFERLLREHLQKQTLHQCPEQVKKRVQALIERF